MASGIDKDIFSDCNIFSKIGGKRWKHPKPSCPKTAPDVAFHLLEMLTSKEKTIEVKKAMGY